MYNAKGVAPGYFLLPFQGIVNRTVRATMSPQIWVTVSPSGGGRAVSSPYESHNSRTFSRFREMHSPLAGKPAGAEKLDDGALNTLVAGQERVNGGNNEEVAHTLQAGFLD